MTSNIIVYGKVHNGYNCYDGRSFKTSDKMANYDHCFQIPKCYLKGDTKSALKQYYTDFNTWSEEIKNSTIVKSFDYRKCQSHKAAIIQFFRRYGGSFDSYEPITIKEYQWYDNCYNGGLIRFPKKPGKYRCQTFDYSSFYPNLLGSKKSGLKIPTTQGKEYTLKRIPKQKIKYGVYRVKIYSDDDNFHLLFKINLNHYYTSQSLSHAIHLSKTYDVTIELIQDGSPNALLYDDDSLIFTKHIFNTWFTPLYKLKQQYPKNGLIKSMFSGLWGRLTAKRKTKVSLERLDKYDYDLDYSCKYHLQTEEYPNAILLNCQKPYMFNTLRLTPFLTSCGRARIANLTSKIDIPLSKIIRIHTDGITYIVKKDNRYKLDMYGVSEEAKTTGYIDWKNVQSYKKIK